MKYSNLLLVGSLLATTAISSAANAAFVYLSAPNTTGTGVALANPKNISAQAFVATNLAAVTVGTQKLFIRFAQNTSAVFTGTVNVTGAKFVTAGINTKADAAVFLGASTPSVFETTTAASTAACTVLAGVSSLILTCDTTKLSGVSGGGTTVGSTSVNGVWISGVAFDTTAATLSVAGSSVTLDFTMVVGTSTFDSAAATNVITSRNSIAATSTSASPALIDVAATPAAFNKFAASATAATIGSINFTLGSGSTFGQDLSTVLTAGAIVGNTELKITSPIFPATAIALLGANTSGITAVSIDSTSNDQSVTVTQFGAGFVTFTIGSASVVDSYTINVNFNGTSEIPASAAGTTLVTYTARAGDGEDLNVIAPPTSTGTVAALTRNGFNIDFNGVQPGTAQGARTYTSLIRISNTGLVGGTVAIVVTNETTGVVLGTYTSASIPAGASLQVSSAQIEAGAGITASASVLYRLSLTGGITGYAQHVNWNQDAGFFSDLSSRRTAKTGSDL